MREEQLRRWQAWKYNQIPEGKTKKPARVKFAQYASLFDDSNEDKRADEAAKTLAAKEKEREKKEMEEDENQAKILAEIQLQEEVASKTAEAEKRAEELRQREEAIKEEAEKERRAQLEREQYMTMKEARLAAEREAKAQAERGAAAKKLAEEREKEEKRLAEARKKAEAEAKTQAEAKQREIYLSMREMREQQRKAKEEEERRLDVNFAQQEAQAKKADADQREAAERARRQSSQEALLEKTANILTKLQTQKSDGGSTGVSGGVVGRTQSLQKRAAPLPPGGAGQTGTIPGAAKIQGDQSGDPEVRSSRPVDESSVINWFKTVETPRGIGRDAAGRWQPFFHGMISRTDAENLLRGQPVGAFLIRVSSRIWGYTLSFVDNDRFKHFLIDATDGHYTVFGAQTSRSHKDLNTLVRFHQSIAVSKTGTRLTNPVGAKNGNRSIIQMVS